MLAINVSLFVHLPCRMGNTLSLKSPSASSSYNLPASSSTQIPQAWGVGLTKPSQLGLSVPESLSVCILASCGSLCLSAQLLQEETSLVRPKQGTDLPLFFLKRNFSVSQTWWWPREPWLGFVLRGASATSDTLRIWFHELRKTLTGTWHGDMIQWPSIVTDMSSKESTPQPLLLFIRPEILLLLTLVDSEKPLWKACLCMCAPEEGTGNPSLWRW